MGTDRRRLIALAGGLAVLAAAATAHAENIVIEIDLADPATDTVDVPLGATIRFKAAQAVSIACNPDASEDAATARVAALDDVAVAAAPTDVAIPIDVPAGAVLRCKAGAWERSLRTVVGIPASTRPAELRVAKGTKVPFRNTTSSPVDLVCDGTNPAVRTAVPANSATDVALTPLDDAEEIVCSAGGGTVALVSITPAGGPEPDTNACPDSPYDSAHKELMAACEPAEDGRHRVCVGPTGRILDGGGELRDGDDVEVQLVGRRDRASDFTLAVTNDRLVLLGVPPAAGVTKRSGRQFAVVRRHRLKVRGAGTLAITISFEAHEVDVGGTACKVDKGEHQVELPVSGDYYFRLGAMIAYADSLERRYALATGDDGVSRIVANDRSGTDFLVTLAAYPAGVPSDFGAGVAFAFVLGTPATDFGDRWYLGALLELPLGFGLGGGVLVTRSDGLDHGLVAGQPFDGETLPTTSEAVASWFLGVNLDASLFARAFKSLTSDK